MECPHNQQMLEDGVAFGPVFYCPLAVSLHQHCLALQLVEVVEAAEAISKQLVKDRVPKIKPQKTREIK